MAPKTSAEPILAWTSRRSSATLTDATPPRAVRIGLQRIKQFGHQRTAGRVPRSREDIFIIDPVILNLAMALGIGLLIGAERERRKGEGPSRSPAGIRTFTVASLAGAASFVVGGEVLLAVATAGVIILTAVA
jgi:hypothetical protein